MASVLLGLGPFRFSVTDLNYNALNRTFEYRWEPQARIGRRPAHQFLGPGVEQITLQGEIYPHFTGGFGQLERMRADAQQGVPYPLASGYGVNHGTFCIKSIADEQTIFHKSGAPLKVMFQIGLVAYGGDNLGIGLSFGALALPVVGSLIPPVVAPAPIAAVAGVVRAADEVLDQLLPD